MSTRIRKSEDPYSVASIVFRKLHEGAICAECEQRIEREDEGMSSFIGSIHPWCATDDNS